MGLKMKAWLLSLTLASTESYLEQTQKPFPYVDCSPVCGGSWHARKDGFEVIYCVILHESLTLKQ